MIILDCCFAANAARDIAEGTTKEILAACVRESPTVGVGERSFTSVLIEELQAFGDRPFTVAMLHSRLVTMRWRLVFTPFYTMLSEHGGNSITIRPLRKKSPPPIPELDSIPTHPGETGGLDFVPDISASATATQTQIADTRVLLSISVAHEAELELTAWTTWLTTAAPWDVMKVDVKIHSLFRSHSTLALISVPINGWNLLPKRPAYRFIGFIRSDNLLEQKNLGPADGMRTRSMSKWPKMAAPKSEKGKSTSLKTPETPYSGRAARKSANTSVKRTSEEPYMKQDGLVSPRTSQIDSPTGFSRLRTPDQAHLTMLPSSFDRHSSQAWPERNDDVLMQARQRGLNWQPIASQYFPGKTANACRKRHERLMEKRNHAEDWEGVKLESLAASYNDVREQMWKILADILGEKWQIIEARVSTPTK